MSSASADGLRARRQAGGAAGAGEQSCLAQLPSQSWEMTHSPFQETASARHSWPVVTLSCGGEVVMGFSQGVPMAYPPCTRPRVAGPNTRGERFECPFLAGSLEDIERDHGH